MQRVGGGVEGESHTDISGSRRYVLCPITDTGTSHVRSLPLRALRPKGGADRHISSRVPQEVPRDGAWFVVSRQRAVPWGHSPPQRTLPLAPHRRAAIVVETVRSTHSFGHVRRPIRPSKSTFEGPLHKCTRACGVKYAKTQVPPPSLPLGWPFFHQATFGIHTGTHTDHTCKRQGAARTPQSLYGCMLTSTKASTHWGF